MTILHYFLGFPPKRSGGLTRYAIDLMYEEESLGHDVIAVYPKMILTKSKIRFKYKGSIDNVMSYEMIGSLPIPLLYGVKNPSDYMIDYDGSKPAIKNFFDRVRP